jgi:hypothetical protein
MQINIIILGDGKNQESPTQSSSLERGKRLFVPKINEKGCEFITGASHLREAQIKVMRETKLNLWQ